MKFVALALLAVSLVTPGLARAQDATPATPSSDDDRVTALERRLDAVTRELESMRLGGAADTATASARRLGFAPAASKVYSAGRGVSIGGYGEMLLEKFDGEREDGTGSGASPRLDLLRSVLYFGYKFTEELLFNSEIEIEHAGISDVADGEVVVEFAYLDWMPRREIGVRAGMVLMPLGFTNELHEPPVFIGSRRADVERLIIPTTWRANGAGVFGEIGSGLAYRAFVTEGLEANGFSAAEALRGGRQSGSESDVTHPAVSARVDFAGLPGVLVGVSGYTGNSWQDDPPGGVTLEPTVTLWDAHARLQWQSLDLRALWASGTLDDAGELSDVLGLTGDERLGERFFGAYVEAAYDVVPLFAPGSTWGLTPYVRVERLDTQDDVPGGVENPANERSVITAGLGIRPHPNVVLKIDRQQRSNEAETATSQWNAQLGYLF